MKRIVWSFCFWVLSLHLLAAADATSWQLAGRLAEHSYWVGFPTLAGHNYQVEYSISLQTNSWQPLVLSVPGNGGDLQIMDPSSITNQEKRFYRVLQIPVYNPGEPPGNPDPSRWTWLQPGLYSMGSPDSATYRESDEAPVTRVTLTHGFWMSRYEVIQEEYQSLMGTNPSWFTNDLKRPVENVSWSDATNYCGQLTRHEQAAGRLPAGCLYRLPTEAEWEYSCRAGSTTRYSFGEDPTGSLLGYYAWVYDNSGSSVPPNGNFYFIDGKYYTSQATGSRQPNPWGLYDMHGNVWEWCLDWYQANLPGGSVVDPQGPTNGATRVIRGGSWNCGPQTCRSAYRCSSDPSVQSSGLGFRPILTTY